MSKPSQSALPIHLIDWFHTQQLSELWTFLAVPFFVFLPVVIMFIVNIRQHCLLLVQSECNRRWKESTDHIGKW